MVIGMLPACGHSNSVDRADDLAPPVAGQLDRVGATPPPAERQMLIANELGEFTESTAQDLTEPPYSGQVSVVLYGDPEADDPFGDQDLGVWYSADPRILGAQPSDDDDQRDTVTVRDKQAYVDRSSRDPRRGPTGATVVSWIERDGLAISLRSHRFSVDELTSIAERLDVTGGSVRLARSGSDRGLSEAFSVENIAWSVGDAPVGPAVRSVSYWRFPGSTGNVDYGIKTWTLSDDMGIDDLVTLFRFDHPGAHTQTVRRNRDAIVYEWPTVADLDDDEQVDVMWLETPTVAVTASGHGGGITATEMLAFVETLRAATPAEAEQLLAAGE
jgi:hypothetical protein